MSATLRPRRMTQQEFFDWAQQQDLRYEYDGEGPVLMTGGNNRHSLINRNLHMALNSRLAGTVFTALGPDAGLATVGETVRYPDALVTPATVPGLAYTVPGVVAVFETLSPTSGRMDRVLKVREYRAVESIRRYVILDFARPSLAVLSRVAGDADWLRTTRQAGELLDLPGLGIALPVDALYAGIVFADAPA